MISNDLLRDAELLANSEKGMKKLVCSLLYSLTDSEKWFIAALRRYVYYKRARKILRKNGYKAAFSPYINDSDVYMAKKEKDSVANMLAKETSAEHVVNIQKGWGKVLSMRYENDEAMRVRLEHIYWLK